MAYQRVLFLTSEIDITDRVRELIPIIEEKSIGRDKMYNNNYNIIVKNFDNAFSGNGGKLIAGINYLYEPIKIYNKSNILTWSGIIIGISRDYDKQIAIIHTIHILDKFMTLQVVYTSIDWESPAAAAKAIMDSYGFSYYNSTVIGETIKEHINNGCLIKANITADNGMAFMPTLEKLAEYSAADCYGQSNEILFSYFREKGEAYNTITKKEMLSGPFIEDATDWMYNNYTISHYEDPDNPVTDITDPDGIGQRSREKFGIRDLAPLGGTENDIIQIKDEIAARYIGRKYIKRGHLDLLGDPRAKQQITVRLKPNTRKWIELDNFVNIDFIPENWTGNNIKIFEPIQREIDDETNQINFVGIEVEHA